MDKRIIVVTGASSGIGKYTATQLAKQGHHVIMHGRDPEKTKKVYEEIKKESGSKNVDMMIADLSLTSEVRKMADEIKAKYDHIDTLLNNAGGQFGGTREVTAEGHEKTMAINVMAPYLLTELFISLLQKSEDGRVVTVSSAAYTAGGKFDPDDIEFEKQYSLFRSYGLTKRYVYWVMLKYHQQDIPGVTFNTLEPGSTPSSLGRVSAQNGLYKLIDRAWTKFFTWPMERSAATSLYLSTSDEVKGISGEFYGDCKPHNIKAKYKVQSEIDAVWEYCKKVCD